MIDRAIAVLIIGALVLGSLACFAINRFCKSKTATPGPCDAAAAEPPRTVEVIVTSGDKRFARLASKQLCTTSLTATRNVIEFFPQKRFQSVLGFGGAFTDAACIDFELLSQDEREKIFRNLFEETGFSVVRVNIGSSDYAPRLRSLCESRPADPYIASLIEDYNKKHGTKYAIPMEPDPQLKTFSLDFDEKHIIPLLKLAAKYAPNLWIKAAAWSPPAWMKRNQSMEGGNIQVSYMPAYAKYLALFIKGYGAQGVKVNSITTNNEVDTDQDGRMAACIWSAENEALFVGYICGPEFERQGIDTEIWLLDHNTNLWSRAASQMEVKEVRKYAKGVAMHWYAGSADKMTMLHNQYPDVPIYYTEGGPDITDPNYAKDWVKWGKTITEVMRNWCRSFIAWNLALDEEGKPNIGPFPCGGVITINKKTKEIAYSGQYYALGQFSKFVKRDAVRIDSQGTIAGISHVGFVNPDGSMVAVLTNDSAETRALTLKFESQSVDVELEPNSVTTFVI